MFVLAGRGKTEEHSKVRCLVWNQHGHFVLPFENVQAKFQSIV